MKINLIILPALLLRVQQYVAPYQHGAYCIKTAAIIFFLFTLPGRVAAEQGLQPVIPGPPAGSYCCAGSPLQKGVSVISGPAALAVWTCDVSSEIIGNSRLNIRFRDGIAEQNMRELIVLHGGKIVGYMSNGWYDVSISSSAARAFIAAMLDESQVDSVTREPDLKRANAEKTSAKYSVPAHWRPAPHPCTKMREPGIVLVVKNEAGQIIADADVTLREGTYKERLGDGSTAAYSVPRRKVTYTGAIERPGKYALEIRRQGYLTQKLPVTVERQSCNVKTVRLTVTLKNAN